MEKGWFDVTITWREALPQKDLYTMRAHYQKDGSLFYDNCRYLVRTFDDNGKFKDDVKYTNGSGILKLKLADKTLYWTDYKLSPGSNTQAFIKNDPRPRSRRRRPRPRSRRRRLRRPRPLPRKKTVRTRS